MKRSLLKLKTENLTLQAKNKRLKERIESLEEKLKREEEEEECFMCGDKIFFGYEKSCENGVTEHGDSFCRWLCPKCVFYCKKCRKTYCAVCYALGNKGKCNKCSVNT